MKLLKDHKFRYIMSTDGTSPREDLFERIINNIEFYAEGWFPDTILDKDGVDLDYRVLFLVRRSKEILELYPNKDIRYEFNHYGKEVANIKAISYDCGYNPIKKIIIYTKAKESNKPKSINRIKRFDK